MNKEEFGEYVSGVFSPPTRIHSLWVERFPEIEQEILSTQPSDLTPAQLGVVFDMPFADCTYALPRALELISLLPLDEISNISFIVSLYLSSNVERVRRFDLFDYSLSVLRAGFLRLISSVTAPGDRSKEIPRYVLPFLLREGRDRDDFLSEFRRIENAHSIEICASLLRENLLPPFRAIERACHFLDLCVMSEYFRTECLDFASMTEMYSCDDIRMILEDRMNIRQAWDVAGEFIQGAFPQIYVNNMIAVMGTYG